MIDGPLSIGDKIAVAVMSCVTIVMFAIFIVGIFTVTGWLANYFHGPLQ